MLDLLPYLVAALVFIVTVSVFTLRRTRMLEAFEALARRHGGTIGQGPWGIYPRIVFTLDDGSEVHVSGIQGSNSGRVTSTFAWVGCDDYPELTFDARRKPARMEVLERLGQTDANTGHSEFDEAFWMQADDEKDVRDLFDEELRYALLAFERSLRVRLRAGALLTFPEGWRTAAMKPSLELTVRRLPPEVDDVERMLDLVRLVHAKLLQVRRAQAA